MRKGLHLRPLGHAALLALMVVAYDAALNLAWFATQGWPATHGPDLWFYLLVARGQEALSPLDLTRWLVRPAAWFGTEDGFLFLITLAVALHATAALLVHHFLQRLSREPSVIQLSPKGCFGLALLFAFLPHQALLATASFTHLVVAQPFLILAVALLIPWCFRRTPRPDLWGLLCLGESMLLGPEGFLAAFALGCVRVGSPPSSYTSQPSCRGRCYWKPALGIWILLTVTLGFEPLFALWSRLVLHFRGLDLMWQRAIASSDLTSPGWRLLFPGGGFGLLWGALVLAAAWRRRWLIVFLLTFFLILAFQVSRAAFTLQLVGFASLVALAQIRCGAGRWRHLSVMALVVLLALVGFGAPQAPVLAPHLVTLAREIASDPNRSVSKVIACSPTFGFFFRAWTGHPVTDDMHHQSDRWQRLTSCDPEEAGRIMRAHDIGWLVVTSHDFQREASGYQTSSGLGAALEKLTDEQLGKSVVFLLDQNPVLLTPLHALTSTGDTTHGPWAIALAPTRK